VNKEPQGLRDLMDLRVNLDYLVMTEFKVRNQSFPKTVCLSVVSSYKPALFGW
jgi:hypothetical protein